MAYTLREGGHIRIDAFSGKFSQTSKAVIDLIGYLFFVLPCLCWVTWSLWSYWLRSYNTNELSGQSAWNPIVWPFKLIFFLAFALLTAQIVAEVIKAILYLTGKRARYEAEAKVEAH